jgi:hypothetical protein
VPFKKKKEEMLKNTQHDNVVAKEWMGNKQEFSALPHHKIPQKQENLLFNGPSYLSYLHFTHKTLSNILCCFHPPVAPALPTEMGNSKLLTMDA